MAFTAECTGWLRQWRNRTVRRRRRRDRAPSSRWRPRRPAGFLTPEQVAFYESLPVAPDLDSIVDPSIVAECDADLTDDDIVNVIDLLILLGDWGGCP
jgi:hypothetical protein